MNFKDLKEMIRKIDGEIKRGELGAMMQSYGEETNLTEIRLNKRLTSCAGRATHFDITRSTTYQRLELAQWAIHQWSTERLVTLAMHEYAHCLAPVYEGHGTTWRALFRNLLNHVQLQHVEVSRCYESAHKRKSQDPTLFEGRLKDCETLEDCMILRQEVKSRTTGAVQTKLLNKIGMLAIKLA